MEHVYREKVPQESENQGAGGVNMSNLRGLDKFVQFKEGSNLSHLRCGGKFVLFKRGG